MKDLFAYLFATEADASDPAAVCGSDNICAGQPLPATALFFLFLFLLLFLQFFFCIIAVWKLRPAPFLVACHGFLFFTLHTG